MEINYFILRLLKWKPFLSKTLSGPIPVETHSKSLK